MDIATLGIRIDSNGVVKATGDLKGMEGQAKRSEDSIDGLSRAFRMLAPLVGTVMAAFSIRALTGYADAWSDMQSRVGAAVKNMEAAPALMERLVDVANASYSPLAQTVEIYGRNVAVLRDLGRNATEAADFTEALNHALVTTATKGQDADVVLNALSRAISTGKLRAMEYETIMSRSPRVLEAVADAMGTTVTGLRQMAVDGKVTGGIIVDALIGSLEELREEAGEMPATIGDALVRIQTNFGALVGRVDQATGASEDFAISLIGLADSIRNMTDDFVRAAVVAQTIFGSAIDGVTGLVASLGIEFDGMATLIIAGAGAAGFAVTTLGFITLRTMAAIGTALMMNPFALLIGGIAAAVTAVYVFRDEIKQLIGVDVVGLAKDAANAIIGSFVGGWRVIAETAGAAWQAIVTMAGGVPVGLNAVWANIKAAFFDMIAALQERWANFLHNMSATMRSIPGMEDLGLSISGAAVRAGSAFYELSAAAETARASAAGLQQEATTLINGGLADLSLTVQRIGQILGESLSDDYLGAISDALRDVWDNAEGAAAAFADLADDDEGGSDPLGLDGAAGKLNAYQEAVKSVREGIQTLEQQALAFGLSETAASRFNTAMDLLRAAQEAGIPITSGLINEINGLADAYALAEERTRQLQQQQQLAIDINNTLAQGFSNMFTGIIDGSKSAGQAIGDLLKSLGQLLINNAFKMLFSGGGMGGGGGGLLGGFLIPGILHGGGKVGADGYGHNRIAPAALWAGAPRFHTGFRNNEFAAILEKNEQVITELQSKRLARVMGTVANLNIPAANDNGAGRGDLHVHINGSGLTEEQLGRAIANGIREYDGALAPKVEAKFRQMQSDPRAADGGW